MIRALNIPDEKVIKEIREVESICKKHDKLRGSIYLDKSVNFNPEMKSLFLLYENGRLVSLISMFIPTIEEAEISAFTLPEYRGRGYFKRLLDEAMEELKKYNISSMLFVCEAQSSDGKKVVERLEGQLDFTEHLLRYRGPADSGTMQQASWVKLLKAEQKDLDVIIRLSQDVFNDSYEEARDFAVKCFEDHNRVQYIALLDEKPIGMGAFCMEDGVAYIFGFGVSPKYQGQGFGKEILKLMLKDMKNNAIENIAIEVEDTNTRAFNLYKKCGFKLETSFNYFRKGL